MARPGDTLNGYFLVENLAGAPTNADATPAVEIRRNGVAVAVSVTVTNPETGEYGFSFVAPVTWLPGDYVVAVVDLVIGGVAVQAYVAEWTLDTSLPNVPLPTTSGLPGYRDEWKWWPNLEPVTLRVAAKGGVYTDRAVPYAKRRAVNTREAIASGGAYTQADLVWLVPNELLPAGVKPKPADQVRPADGTDWTVLEISPLGKFGNTHRLVTRNLVLHADLRDALRVLRPSAAVDAAAQRSPVFAEAYATVPCRLQEQEQAVADDYQGGPTGRREYTLWVGQRLQLRAGDVIEIDGVRYDFLGSANWDRIDQLGEVRVYKAGV